jgi:hypothetical protein
LTRRGLTCDARRFRNVSARFAPNFDTKVWGNEDRFRVATKGKQETQQERYGERANRSKNRDSHHSERLRGSELSHRRRRTHAFREKSP